MNLSLRSVSLIALFSSLFLVGCGASVAPALGEYVDVKGTVEVNGKPVKASTIYFKKDGEAGRDEFVDVKDGAFALKMFLGKYKVAFDTETKRINVPAKYTKYNTTDLTLEVKSGGVSDAKFSLK